MAAQSFETRGERSRPDESHRWISWNGNIVHSYSELTQPRTEAELAAAVRQAQRVRVFGNRQSSADIAAGTDSLIDLSRYCSVVEADERSMQITVQSGITLKSLITEIESRGWCLPCLPDIDTVTLGGALATGTHGTGGDGHPLAHYMVGCRLVSPDGSVDTMTETDGEFNALRCSLGLLGVLSTVTLQCHPLYYLRVQEEAIRDDEWQARYREWLVNYDFVRVIWLPHTGYAWVVLGTRVDSDLPVQEHNAPSFTGYRRKASTLLYKPTVRFPRFTRTANSLLKTLFFSHRTVSKGTLYGATVTKSRSSTLELAEWAVAMDRFDELFAELRDGLERRDNRAYAHIPMDIRFLKPDQTWLSQAFGHETVTVGCVTRHPEHAGRYRAFDLVESLFLHYQGRPHWAKRFRAGAAELAPLWQQWDSFVTLRRRLDPGGKFLNQYLAEIFE